MPDRLSPAISGRGLLAGAAGVFVETASLIALVVVVVHLYRSDVAFGALSPHPLWIPVILISAQHGALGGTIAALGATAALYGVTMPLRAPSQDFYSYAGVLVVQPIQWLAYAIIIGGLRSLHMLRAAALQSELDDSTRTAIEFADGLDRALSEIERLERRIAGDAGTLNATLRSLARLDFQDAQTVISGFAPIISDSLGAAVFTVYSKSPEGLEPRFRFDDEGDGSLSKAPALDASLWGALEAGRGIIGPLDADREALIPTGAFCAAAIKSIGADPAGVLLIERLRPDRQLDEAPRRARLLGLALGSALAAATQEERAAAQMRS
jgi:hypothetical protein